jgi:hypothetical protein
MRSKVFVGDKMVGPPTIVRTRSETTIYSNAPGEIARKASTEMNEIFSTCYLLISESHQLIAKVDKLLQRDRGILRP